MALKSLNDLATNQLDDNVDVANLPEQGRQFPDPPHPGSYRFALPRLSLANFDITEKDGKQIVKVKFDETAPLKIVQSPADAKNGEPFETSLSNMVRERGKKGSNQFASDWDYLNQALEEPTRPKNNKEFVERLIAASLKGKEFSADLEWSWGCNNQRDAFFPDGNGGVTPVPNEATPGQNHKGCGKKYYQNAVGKVGGEYPVRIICDPAKEGCGAQLRAFANLTRIRK